MTVPRSSRSLLVLGVALVLASCGEPTPVLLPHEIETDPLPATSLGQAVETFTDVRPGAWRGRVKKTWTEIRDGGPPRHGKAILRLDVEIRETDVGLTTRVVVKVLEAEGLAETHVRPFDGLEGTVGHLASGAPDRATLRIVSSAPAKGPSFLRGFWLAGIGGATAWFPPGPLREGEAWPRSRLGERALVAGLEPVAGGPPRFRGGGRLEEVLEGEAGGDTLLRVRLDGLLETALSRPGEAVSWGLRDWGEARIRARDGIPRSWTLHEEFRLRQSLPDGQSEYRLRMDVEGELTPRPPDGR